MPVDKLFAQWRVVNEQANEAERRLFEASLNYLRGNGPAPGEVDRAKAAQLRSEARALFARALGEVDAGLSDARGAHSAIFHRSTMPGGSGSAAA